MQTVLSIQNPKMYQSHPISLYPFPYSKLGQWVNLAALPPIPSPVPSTVPSPIQSVLSTPQVQKPTITTKTVPLVTKISPTPLSPKIFRKKFSENHRRTSRFGKPKSKSKMSLSETRSEWNHYVMCPETRSETHSGTLQPVASAAPPPPQFVQTENRELSFTSFEQYHQYQQIHQQLIQQMQHLQQMQRPPLQSPVNVYHPY